MGGRRKGRIDQLERGKIQREERNRREGKIGGRKKSEGRRGWSIDREREF